MTKLNQLQEELQELLDQRVAYRNAQAKLIAAKKTAIYREINK